MSEFNLKVGDKVYYPHLTTRILKVVASENSPNLVAIEKSNKLIDITADGKIWNNQGMVSDVFPATQEWYKRLSYVYPNLEKPPIKKSSKEIVQALLDAGNTGVLCWVSDSNTEPTSTDFLVLITELHKYYQDFGGDVWLYATPVIPIKSLNQTITDYVNGKVVLESENDIS